MDAGQRPGASSEEPAEIRRLRAEVKELRGANEILKAARVLRGRAGPATDTIVRFTGEHKGVFGVEPICRVLTGTARPFAQNGGVKAAPEELFCACTAPRLRALNKVNNRRSGPTLS